MKTRQGFVSNSSATSFSVFGILIPDDEAFLVKLLGEPKVIRNPGCNHEIDREKLKFCPECGKPSWVEYKEEYCDICDYEEQIKKIYSLDAVQWSGGELRRGGYYLGKNLQRSLKDKCSAIEKVEELKRIIEKLKTLYPDIEPDFYSDCNYDG